MASLKSAMTVVLRGARAPIPTSPRVVRGSTPPIRRRRALTTFFEKTVITKGGLERFTR
jgi:hypothetical protein